MKQTFPPESKGSTYIWGCTDRLLSHQAGDMNIFDTLWLSSSFKMSAHGSGISRTRTSLYLHHFNYFKWNNKVIKYVVKQLGWSTCPPVSGNDNARGDTFMRCHVTDGEHSVSYVFAARNKQKRKPLNKWRQLTHLKIKIITQPSLNPAHQQTEKLLE